MIVFAALCSMPVLARRKNRAVTIELRTSVFMIEISLFDGSPDLGEAGRRAETSIRSRVSV